MTSTTKMAHGWAEQIEEAQELEAEEIGGKTYPRIRYGDDYPNGLPQCRSCGVEHGQLHVVGCTVERCPACRQQAYGCDCYSASEVQQ